MMDELKHKSLEPNVLFKAMNDGLYATDRDRRIIYWSPAAEKITGWREQDILGKLCSDEVLSHVDKNGHSLCSTESCPLHRAVVTGKSSKVPIIVFAKGSDGKRIPMRVSVAPVRNDLGEVIGGVETFHEVSDELKDAQLARRIQASMLQKGLPQDERASFNVRYLPLEMVGGDYYSITRINADQIAFILADVSGHGMAAALYTVHLDALWCNHTDLHASPAALASIMTKKLSEVIGNEPCFITAMLGLIDLKTKHLVLTSAGGPWPFLFRKNGNMEVLDGSGLPLGYPVDTEKYKQRTYPIGSGDCFLAFTDGALDIHEAEDKMLGSEGLTRVLEQTQYPKSSDFDFIAESLLSASNQIQLNDDLTFLEIRIT